ncbi:DUF6489 family protein [Aestuariivirga sp.]|uniref:DUF6489 family protein n=1 Tax=Aestuariivirga sp. TaxID=2650926 RepID=UPI0039E5BB3D
MKITMTVDCTPEEARAFLGLPDFSAIQQQFVSQVQDQLRQQMSTDPETAMKAWFGPAMQGLDMQRNYWQQMFKPAEPKEP